MCIRRGRRGREGEEGRGGEDRMRVKGEKEMWRAPGSPPLEGWGWVFYERDDVKRRMRDPEALFSSEM